MTEQKYTYAILQETSGEDCESWLYFIRYQGNEEEIKFLGSQLDPIRWSVDEYYNAFELEYTNLVSETTAKEMTKVDLNSVSYHRKFDGKLHRIDFKFNENTSNRKKIKIVNKTIANGCIDDFIDKEDVELDEDDKSEYDSKDSELESDSESEEDSETDTDSESETESSSEEEEVKPKTVPNALKKIPIPRAAQIKQAKKH